MKRTFACLLMLLLLYAPTDAPAQLTGYVRMAQLDTER